VEGHLPGYEVAVYSNGVGVPFSKEKRKGIHVYSFSFCIEASAESQYHSICRITVTPLEQFQDCAPGIALELFQRRPL
jgi:hypothetical protein